MLQEKLKNIIFSKENTSELYSKIISNNSLNNLNIDNKTFLTQNLVQMMKAIFDKIDPNKLTNNNLNTVLKGSNELILKKMDDIVKQNNLEQNTISSKRGMIPIQRTMDINGINNIKISSRPEHTSLKDNMRINKSYDNIIPNNNIISNFNPTGESTKINKEESVQDRLKRLEDERKYNVPRDRPPTPDFSLDGTSNKKKINNDNLNSVPDERYVKKQIQNDMDQFYNPITDENFIKKQDVNLESFNNFDIEPNIDSFNTGINPRDIIIDESIPITTKLEQIQRERGMIDNIINNNHTNINQIQNNQNNQHNQHNVINKSIQNQQYNEQNIINKKKQYQLPQHQIPQHQIPQHQIPQYQQQNLPQYQQQQQIQQQQIQQQQIQQQQMQYQQYQQSQQSQHPQLQHPQLQHPQLQQSQHPLHQQHSQLHTYAQQYQQAQQQQSQHPQAQQIQHPQAQQIQHPHPQTQQIQHLQAQQIQHPQSQQMQHPQSQQIQSQQSPQQSQQSQQLQYQQYSQVQKQQNNVEQSQRQLQLINEQLQIQLKNILSEQENNFKEEINKLKIQLSNNNSNNNNNSANVELLNQIQVLNYELGQQKTINN